MEDLAERLDKMIMETPADERLLQNNDEHNHQLQTRLVDTCRTYNDINNEHHQGKGDNCSEEDDGDDDIDENDALYDNERRMSVDGENVEPSMKFTSRSEKIVFQDSITQTKFESLFRAYDERVQFRYLKSFRRVRLDFTAPQRAELARVSMNNYKLGCSSIKCYLVQMIRPSNLRNNSSSLDTNEEHELDGQDEDDEDDPYKQNSNYLSIPKRSKQFLLSPPISPPAGWMPREEATPCIDVQLISALANLVPGEVHELHEGNESQPHIFVEVCEEVEQDPHLKSISSARGRIPKTPSPLAASSLMEH